MTEELYKTLMNRGFLIYKQDAKVVLKKCITPADTRGSITDRGSYSIRFETWDEAVQEAKSLIGWKEKSQSSIQTADSCWFMQLMYQHKSGPKFVDLGEMGTVTYKVAVAEANERAVRYLEESCEEEDIGGWEVRVRPHKK